jgi:tRNA-(ms[2]io[6]A)-hydroxylase
VTRDIDLVEPLREFLAVATPGPWIDWALDNPGILLIDHANCEKKAAATALGLMHRYTDDPHLLHKLSRLAREELRHFEQVVAIMERRGIPYRPISASRYASGLRAAVRSREPGRLIDTLIVGAVIEARSCERFAALAPRLDPELSDFYLSLLKSEARHFRDYLDLATRLSNPGEAARRQQVFLALDAELVTSEDTEFRFHSGIPVEKTALTC